MTKVILSWSELKKMLKEQFKCTSLEIDEDANVTMEIDLEELKKIEKIYVDRPWPYPIIVDRPYRSPYPPIYWSVTSSTSSKMPQVTFSK